MAVQIVQALPLWLGSTKLRALARSVELTLDREAVEQTTFADSTKVHAAGIRSVSVSATAIADAIQGISPPSPLDVSPSLITIGRDSEADGASIFAFVCRMTSLSFGGSVGDALEPSMELAAEYSAGGSGLILAPAATRTVSGTGTGRQFGALATGASALVGVHVFSVAGTSPSLSVTLQTDDASAFASPTAVKTVGPISTIGGYYDVVIGPVTDTWWRATWTISGTSPSIEFAIIIAA